MAKIIAIGGGDVREGATLQIDKEIVKFSDKKNPKLLFIPTASSDSEGYSSVINAHFTELGCDVDILYLIKKEISIKDIEDKILNSDIIYVGGGNTLKMMTIWRKLGVDKILEKALNKNIVLCGLSSGSICWFKYGNSDSRKFTGNSTKFIKVTGLGFIDALHCPHYDTEINRQEDLDRTMKKSTLVSIAIEDNCAIQIEDDRYRIITGKENAKAYKVYWKNREYFKKEIPIKEEFMPLNEILKKV